MSEVNSSTATATVKRSYKYKCREPGCSAVVDDKKWHRHCETHHKFKTIRHEYIKRDIVQFRVGTGTWLPYSSQTFETSSSVVPLS